MPPRYASVYPLVASRAVARPFTYEVPPDVGKGAVVSLRFHGARRRGVVVGLEERPPEGIEAALVGDVVDALPEPLVDLALWLADYYGSTPARALELVAPIKRRARGERASPVAYHQSSSNTSRRGRRELPPPRCDGKREDRGLHPGVHRRARAWPRRDRARP